MSKHWSSGASFRALSVVIWAAVVSCGGRAGMAQLPISKIDIFTVIGPFTNRGDQQVAIDGNSATNSFLTRPFTDVPQIAALDLGAATSVNRFRAVNKFGNVDAAGGIDNVDLQLVYSTDSGPIESRTWQPVTGLTSGYLGTELINATAVNAADATVDNDRHDAATDGMAYSLSFDTVNATAIGLQFVKDPADPSVFNHYRVGELEAYMDATKQTASSLNILRTFPDGFQPPNSRPDLNVANDNDPFTSSFVTKSGTITPQLAIFDLGSATTINRFRADKSGNTDGSAAGAPGLGAIDNMDLQLLYSTDTGPLNERTYQPVAGLTSGYLGAELINADSVSALDGTVNNDHHDNETLAQGPYSLSFNPVMATSFALKFARDSADSGIAVHYKAFELDVMNDATELVASNLQVFGAAPAPMLGDVVLNNRGDQARAIDGDTATSTFLTPSFTQDANTAGLDLGASHLVNHLRVAKPGNIDGSGAGAPGIAPIDNMDLEILYTTDTGPLKDRSYQPVTGLTSGFEGAELIDADSVDAGTATVNNDHHDFATDGWYSLSFNAINATAIAIRFKRDSGDSSIFTHYNTFEMEVYEAILMPDVNMDGFVDIFDVNLVSAHWAEAGGPGQVGDANKDGVVDIFDVNLISANWNAPPPPGSGAESVPEPATYVMLSLGMLALAGARCRARTHRRTVSGLRS